MYAQHAALDSSDDLQEYWSDVLACEEMEKQLAFSAQSSLAAFVRKHLPRGRILEAGCGNGQWVILMRRWGYEAEGLDYSELLVREIRRRYPDVPVRFGDIRAIDAQDETYSALLSLGVIEHYQDGPDAILAEARRVVKSARDGGRLLIAVPYHNAVTERVARRRERMDGVQSDGAALRFFQYLYTRREYQSLLERNGLRPLDYLHYDTFSTLSLLAPGLYERASHSGLRAWPAKAIGRALLSGVPPSWTGHMMIAACEKVD